MLTFESTPKIHIFNNPGELQFMLRLNLPLRTLFTLNLLSFRTIRIISFRKLETLPVHNNSEYCNEKISPRKGAINLPRHRLEQLRVEK